MSQLIESILLKDGWFHNLLLHEERLNNTRQALFGLTDFIDLEDTLHEALEQYLDGKPESTLTGKTKCRVVYGEALESIEFIPYKQRSIKSLKVIYDDVVSYKYKFADRTKLDELFGLRDKCDDVIIVKNGFVSDCSSSNLLLFDGRKWITPGTPLLKGTQRQLLLNLETITSKLVKPEEIRYYKKARLVNAMMEFEDEVDVEISNIIQ